MNIFKFVLGPVLHIVW